MKLSIKYMYLATYSHGKQILVISGAPKAFIVGLARYTIYLYNPLHPPKSRFDYTLKKNIYFVTSIFKLYDSQYLCTVLPKLAIIFLNIFSVISNAHIVLLYNNKVGWHWWWSHVNGTVIIYRPLAIIL